MKGIREAVRGEGGCVVPRGSQRVPEGARGNQRGPEGARGARGGRSDRVFRLEGGRRPVLILAPLPSLTMPLRPSASSRRPSANRSPPSQHHTQHPTAPHGLNIRQEHSNASGRTRKAPWRGAWRRCEGCNASTTTTTTTTLPQPPRHARLVKSQ
ncbi:hypothetical protein E2C01_063077 [Portunus trituberculatus]|uniref:Uncharacterized protein n=1 Tax=Portunus trituberculatus TaxID=210409 RepID=A0A5B7HHT0_PORTR|nr:hypothetical protein [Portunus trituberculatus]